jgi:hypothetical protein
MLIKKSLTIAATATAMYLGSGLVIAAQTTGTTDAGMSTAAGNPEGARLASRYSAFAGSPQNAESLVEGLRTGTPISLSPSPTGPNATAPGASLSPATGKMGYGNINIALALAKTSLAKQGITNPTPSQLSATLGGLLSQKADGIGWGQIAKGMGVKLGAVVSASHTSKSGKKANDSVHAVHASNVATAHASSKGLGVGKGFGNNSSGGQGAGNGGGHGGGNGGGNGGGGGGNSGK